MTVEKINMCRLVKSAVLAACVTLSFSARADDVAKWDPRLAVEKASIDTNGVKWIDGRFLPIEGRAFDDVEKYYDRLPSNVTQRVNGGVRGMKHHSTGMQFRFRTDSHFLVFKWVPYYHDISMNHMPATGVSGIDVYRQDGNGRWRHVNTGRIKDPTGSELKVSWSPGAACLVNLPLFNGIRSFSLGIEENAKVEALGPRKSGVEKPVVFYGTSITHGIAASRPGMSFVNIVGRDLDVSVVNLGFSGSGRMELEMSEHLARIDASCYVLDCLWNMDRPRRDPGFAFEDMFEAGYDESDPIAVVRFRYEPFIRALRARRPDVPIVMAEQSDVKCNGPSEKDKFVRAIYEKLVGEGWKNLIYLPKDGMYSGDGDGTVDGCHPNDLGQSTMAKAFEKAVGEALGITAP